jgi:hypothetical protein
MDLIRLMDNAYHQRAGSNAGLLMSGARALVVDSGLDRDAAHSRARSHPCNPSNP